MSVQEIIEQIRALDPGERRQVQEALDQVEAESDATAEERWRRGDDALSQLMRGVGSAGGKCLSEGIDEALYRGER